MNRWQIKIDLISGTRQVQEYVKVEDPAVWIWLEIHANHAEHVHAAGFFVLLV